jgi:diaminopimelate epimerase
MGLRFVKMHGCGNDYVYVDGFRERVEDPAALARRVSNRNFGVGSDGLILVLPSERGDVRMRMWNADGSEAEMCGNGVRCVAKLAYESGHARRPELRVEVGREGATRVLPLRLAVDETGRVRAARVDMGVPDVGTALETVQGFEGLRVSVGNPHFVVFAEPSDENVLGRGPALEKDPAFPRRANIEFARVDGPEEIALRVWERGSGETLACGTGATATVVAAVALRRIPGRRARVRLPGGDLDIEWSEADGRAYMTGPCVEVFRGELAE